MTANVLTFTGSLVIESCPTCGTWHGVPESLRAVALADKRTFIYCPLGHRWRFTSETDLEKAQRQLQYARDNAAAARARADQAEASLRATKGHVTRLRKKVAAGQCPFCGQHLRDLERHVNRQHAQEAAEAIAELEPTA